MYAVSIKKSAQKELEQIPQPYHRKILVAIDALAENPRPESVKNYRAKKVIAFVSPITGLSIP